MNTKWIALLLAAGCPGIARSAVDNESEPLPTVPSTTTVTNEPWSPTNPIRVGSSRGYMDIGLVGTFAVGGSTADDIEGGTELGGHDPNQRGFTVQGVEANFYGAVDPYFRGNANISLGIDSGGDSSLELEEAWLETVSLPFDLKLRAGQILTEYGRLNPTHPHTWDFVDTPLVNGRFLGPDGLRNPGAQLSWLAPTPFYTEMLLSVQNSHGDTAASFRGGAGHSHGVGGEGLPFVYRHSENDRGVSSLSDLLFTPRIVTSFDLSSEMTMLAGLSAAFGPNNVGGDGGGDSRTEIYGTDLTLKWKPLNHHGGFPFVKWQSEAMLRRSKVAGFDWDEAGNGGDANGDNLVDAGILVDPLTGLPAMLPGETLTDYGFYSQLVYGFRKDWTAGMRFDWLDRRTGGYEHRGLLVADGLGGGAPAGNDPLRNSRWRLSPNLTWYPTEFSKLRLQYNYDDRRDIGVDHSVWCQFEFILGAHAAHKF